MKSIPGATTEGMMHHAKGCLVDLTTDIVIFHFDTNDMKKDIPPQEIAQNIIRLAGEVPDGGKRDVLISRIIHRGDKFQC